MNTIPLVSIMIPAYNQVSFLPIALKSALEQDYPNLEVVISDDCSTDGTDAAIREFSSDPRLKYFRNPKNLGRVANYKKCLEDYARGEWVINLDGDDYFTDSAFISKAIRLITEFEPGEIVFLQAGHTIQSSDGKVIREDLPDIEGDYEVISGTRYFLNFNHFSHLATLFNRRKAIDIDFYRYDILSTDIESFLRLALSGKVILVKQSIGVWVHHGSNQSKQLSIPVVEKNMLRIEGPYLYAKSIGIFPETALLQWRNKLIQAYLLKYLSQSFGKNKGLKGYLAHVIKHHPQIIFSSVIPRAVLRAMNS